MTDFCAVGIGTARLRLSCARPPGHSLEARGKRFSLEGLSRALLRTRARGGVSWRSWVLQKQAGTGMAHGAVRATASPAKPCQAHCATAEPGAAGFPGQKPLQAWPGGTPRVVGWGSLGGRMPTMETTAVGTADRLPGTFRAVGGSGHAKVSCSPHQGSAGKAKAPQHLASPLGSASRAARHGSGHVQLCPTRARQTNAPHTSPEQGRAGGCASPLPRQGCPAGWRGQRVRRDGSPVSHPHLSHAHTCSRVAALPSMPPCCSGPLGRQECAPQPRHPGMPFTPWLHLLLLHRCRKVTPDGWEQMVPCHKCHPGSTAWAAPARWPDLMAGKSVLPGFSQLASSFPSLSVQHSSPHKSLGLPRTRWSPAPFMAQTTGWVIAHAAAPGEGLAGQSCPLAAQRVMGHRLATLPGLAWERLGKESWHGLADVGEQVGTYLLSPPQSQAGPCLNHAPVHTWEGAALPWQRWPPPMPPAPLSPPGTGKGAMQHRAVLPGPRLVGLAPGSQVGNLRVTLALWRDGRDLLPAVLASAVRRYVTQPAWQGLASRYLVFLCKLGSLALPRSPCRAVQDALCEGTEGRSPF